MISYIFPFVKQNSKNFLFELFSIFDYSKNPYYQTGGGRGFAVSRKRVSYGKNLPLGQIDERRHLKVLGKFVSWLCRVTSPFTPPPIAKKDRRFCSIFIYPYYQTGGGRGFAVSRERESYGKNLPLGQIDERRHLKVFGKSMSGLCRVTSPFTPPPIQKRHAELRAVFVLVGAVGLEPMTSTMSR